MHREMMKAINLERLTNTVLRVATLGTRLLLVIVLANFLEPKWVGYYGLFTATIGYTMLFAGLDFYIYNNRETIQAPNSARGTMLKSQAILSGATYAILIPASLLLIAYLDWPGVLIYWFVPILLLEHVNQEISRTLIAMSRPVSASVVMFLRQGSWAIAGVTVMALFPETRRLEFLLPAWAGAGLVAALAGAWKVRQLGLGGWLLPIDWRWLKKGLTISLGFLVSTLALRAIQTLDRYWLESLIGIESVAAYVLFFGIASSMMVFLHAGVFSFAYPKLIKLHHSGEKLQASALVRSVLRQTLILVSGFSLVSWLLLPYLITWIDNPFYEFHMYLFPWVLAALILDAIGTVPHYGLYASGFDKPIIASHFVGLTTFVLATWIISLSSPTLAVPIGLGASYLVILILKSLAYIYFVLRRL